MSIIERNRGAILFGTQVLGAGLCFYLIERTCSKIAHFLRQPNTNGENLLRWGWSCIRHPLATAKNVPHSIYKIASFIWGWTFGFAYRTVTSAIDHFVPSLKFPLFAGLVGGGVTFGVHLLDVYWDKSLITLIKMIAIPIITSVAAYTLAHRYTNLTPSKWEAGYCGLLPLLGIITLYTTLDGKDG